VNRESSIKLNVCISVSFFLCLCLCLCLTNVCIFAQIRICLYIWVKILANSSACLHMRVLLCTCQIGNTLRTWCQDCRVSSLVYMCFHMCGYVCAVCVCVCVCVCSCLIGLSRCVCDSWLVMCSHCVHVDMYTCMDMYAVVCLDWSCIHTTYFWKCIHIWTFMHIRVFMSQVPYIWIFIHVWNCIHINMCVHVRTVCRCVYVCVCVYVFVFHWCMRLGVRAYL